MKEVVLLSRIGEFRTALSSILKLLDRDTRRRGESISLPTVLADTLLRTPFCKGEGGGVTVGTDPLVRGGDGEEGKMGSGVQAEILSEMFESHRLFELCVRKIITAPFRGPFGEYIFSARISKSVNGRGGGRDKGRAWRAWKEGKGQRDRRYVDGRLKPV